MVTKSDNKTFIIKLKLGCGEKIKVIIYKPALFKTIHEVLIFIQHLVEVFYCQIWWCIDYQLFNKTVSSLDYDFYLWI